ncbi:tRNA pseudouridine(13) synthase TruD [Endozoicomonas sp. Mp262]|uniref:tRNA pseudouridine(13) synthase TruD n=1 Tax=Endozoicomonas sp. Mp262 TaxID=2919499 RepID=UPI0021DB5359
MNQNSFSLDWHHAWGGPLGHCQFKSIPEDFIVDEELPFEPEGEGEHLLLRIEKTGHNTDWVAGQLARHIGVKRSSISYAGRKDRQGITRQWFCVSLPGLPDPDWQGFETESLQIITSVRHRKKLRTGALKSNRFKITLRQVDGKQAELEKRLCQISAKGVPNYFGHQRFGRNGNNLEKASLLFEGSLRVQRNKRSMYLSAARSWLFNQVLSERVALNNWNDWVAGDVLGFQDNNSLIFDELDESLKARLEQNQVTPTGPLWGRGTLLSGIACKQLEETVCGRYQLLCEGLETQGLQQERRALRLMPGEMSWQWCDSATLTLEFRLPKGCFATSVLRELLVCNEGVPGENTVVE